MFIYTEIVERIRGYYIIAKGLLRLTWQSNTL